MMHSSLYDMTAPIILQENTFRLMNTPYNKNKFDVQCSQNVRRNLIAKDTVNLRNVVCLSSE
jgi:hypothetical protein